MTENPTFPETPEINQEGSKPPKNLVRDIFGIITDPTNTFKRILPIGYWVGIFLITLIVFIGFGQLTHHQLINMSIEKMEAKPDFNATQLEQTKAFFENETLSRIIFFITNLLTYLVIFLIAAILYFFIGSVIFGGTAKFKQVWVVACWASVIYIIDFIIKAILIVAKNNFEMGLNFGLLFTEDMVGSKLHNAFNVVDIFGIWHLIVAGLGLAVLYKFSTKKGIGISFIVWLLMTAVGFIAAFVS